MFTHPHHQASHQSAWQLPDPGADRHRRQRRLATLFAAVTVVIVAAGALAVAFTSKIERDARGCSVETGPARGVEFLIDQSDPFSEELLAFAEDEIRRRVRELGVGDLFSVLTLGGNDQGQLLTEAFSRCRPPDGKEVNRLIDNPMRRESLYTEQFEAPLEAALERALAPTKANTSPLLEALHAIAQRPAFAAGGSGRSLVLFSDALQHSALVSFFTHGYRFEQLLQRNSVYLTGLHEHFAGACVEMYIVSNKYPRQTAWPEFETFWRQYWLAAGVDCLSIRRI